jgi:tetratricopeptide (TPR) repeat protein
MNADEILAHARRGDLSALNADRDALADAVRTFAGAGDSASALELVSRSWRIWLTHGELDVGSAIVAVALQAPAAARVPTWRIRALYADGVLAFRAGDAERSESRNLEALRLAQEEGDVRGECDARTGLARLALRRGRYAEVVTLATQARAQARAAGDLEAEAAPLHLHAAGLRLQHRYEDSHALYLESLQLNARLGNAGWVAMEQHNLGWVELHLGKVDEAMARFRERDAAAVDAYGEAWSELNWAGVALARDDRREARRRFKRGSQLLAATGVTLDPDDQAEFVWIRERLARPC